MGLIEGQEVAEEILDTLEEHLTKIGYEKKTKKDNPYLIDYVGPTKSVLVEVTLHYVIWKYGSNDRDLRKDPEVLGVIKYTESHNNEFKKYIKEDKVVENKKTTKKKKKESEE